MWSLLGAWACGADVLALGSESAPDVVHAGVSLAVSSGVFYGNGAEAVCFRPILVRSAPTNPILCAWLQMMLLACMSNNGSV